MNFKIQKDKILISPLILCKTLNMEIIKKIIYLLYWQQSKNYLLNV